MKFTDILLDILHNQILWSCICAWFVAGWVKVLLILFLEHSWQPIRIHGDGGMPSSHSSFVICLATLIGWGCGLNTPIFALAMTFAVITMHDAKGVRREVGKQALLMQKLAATANQGIEDEKSKIRTDKLKVLVGHTPLQIAVGGCIGFLVAVLSLLICRTGYGSMQIFG